MGTMGTATFTRHPLVYSCQHYNDCVSSVWEMPNYNSIPIDTLLDTCNPQLSKCWAKPQYGESRGAERLNHRLHNHAMHCIGSVCAYWETPAKWCWVPICSVFTPHSDPAPYLEVNETTCHDPNVVASTTYPGKYYLQGCKSPSPYLDGNVL